MLRRCLCVGWMLNFAVILGCSGAKSDRWESNRPPVIAVSGVVLIDQKPLNGAVVVFSPEGDATKPGASAQTDASGRFRLTTFKEGDGVPPGKYLVTVTKVERKVVKPGDGGAIAPVYEDISSVAPKFGQPQTSELTAYIDAPTNNIVLNVTAN